MMRNKTTFNIRNNTKYTNFKPVKTKYTTGGIHRDDIIWDDIMVSWDDLNCSWSGIYNKIHSITGSKYNLINL